MSQELFYTSAPSGIKPGSNGFCTVAMTAGMSALLVQRLEMLSSYRELFPLTDSRALTNPPAFWHLRLSVGTQSFALLSRICFAGADYSKRANIFAHHVVIDSSEQSPGGPACILSQPGFMETQWTGSPRLIPTGRPVPRVDDAPRTCSAWKKAAGDAGWAGVLAETANADSGKVAYVIYSPEISTLPLIREAMALLPERKRWQITFCSYFNELPPACTCAWRFCVAGTAAARDAVKYASSGVIINLTANLGTASESTMVQVARTGEVLEEAPRRPIAAPTLVAVGAEVEQGPAPALPKRSLSREMRVPDESWMPPFNATIIDDEIEATRKSGRHSKHTVWLWLTATVWPLLVIPCVIAWHLSSESQSVRDLSQRVKELIATTQADQVRLSDTRASDNAALDVQKRVNDKKIAELNEASDGMKANLDHTEKQLSAVQQSYDALKAQSIELNKDKSDKYQILSAELYKVKRDSEITQTKLKDSILFLHRDNDSLRARLSIATTQPNIFWDGGLGHNIPKVTLATPKIGKFKWRNNKSGTDVKILDQSGQSIAYIALQCGQLTITRDALAPPSKELFDWLNLCSLRVSDGGWKWSYFRFSVPAFVDLPVTWDLPAFVKAADFGSLDLANGPSSDADWKIHRKGDGWTCTNGDVTVSIRISDGVISWSEELPKDFKGQFPPLVVDLQYQYGTGDDHNLLLCRMTIKG